MPHQVTNSISINSVNIHEHVLDDCDPKTAQEKLS